MYRPPGHIAIIFKIPWTSEGTNALCLCYLLTFGVDTQFWAQPRECVNITSKLSLRVLVKSRSANTSTTLANLHQVLTKSRVSTLRAETPMIRESEKSSSKSEWRNINIKRLKQKRRQIGTVSALPLMARRRKISSPLRGYKTHTSSAIPQQEVIVQLKWNHYARQLTTTKSKLSYSQFSTRVNSDHLCVGEASDF